MKSNLRTSSRVAALALICLLVLSTTNCTAFLRGLKAGLQAKDRDGRSYSPATPNGAQPPTGELAKEFDPGWAHDVIGKKAYDLLYKSDFDSVDKMADDARAKKARLPGGYWQIDSIYEGLGEFFAEYKGQKVSDEMWANKIELLKQWKEKNAKSITARVALAETYINYAMAARGGGYSDTVTQQGWRMFAERLDMAEQELRDAQTLQVKCPRWYREVLDIGMYKGWSADDYDDVYNEAIAFEPNYLQVYLSKSENLTPKWNGEPGDWQKYVDSLPGKLATLKTDEADSIYLIVLLNKMRERSFAINWAMVSHDRIKNGFAVLDKKYGVDNHRLNQYAFLLCISGQYSDANTAFVRIGNDFDKEVWDSKTFLTFKQVAERGRPDIAQVNHTH